MLELSAAYASVLAARFRDEMPTCLRIVWMVVDSRPFIIVEHDYVDTYRKRLSLKLAPCNFQTSSNTNWPLGELRGGMLVERLLSASDDNPKPIGGGCAFEECFCSITAVGGL